MDFFYNISGSWFIGAKRQIALWRNVKIVNYTSAQWTY